jgi:hypothetical protein
VPPVNEVITAEATEGRHDGQAIQLICWPPEICPVTRKPVT